MTTLLVGADQANWQTGPINYVIICRYKALESGILTGLRYKSGDTNGKVKLAIYADAAGPTVGSLLQANNTDTATINGWVELVITSQAIVKDTYYWLAFAIGNATTSEYYAAGTRAYVPITYNGYTFPSTLSGLTYDSFTHAIAGWGTTAIELTASGIATANAFGTAVLKHIDYLLPSGKASGLAFGTAVLKLYLLPSGIAKANAFGSPTVDQGLSVRPSAIASAAAFGSPELLYDQAITPAPIDPAAVFGSATVILLHQYLLPSGFAHANAFGTAALSNFQFITTSAIASSTVFSSPLVSHVLHVILEAQYFIEAPDVNRTYVVGSDATGAQVSGSAITQADVDLVGERLAAHHNPAIPTATVAAAVATAQLAKARLDGKRAQITIAPHCGVELWDVLAVVDPVANQDTFYRVIGYQLEYDTSRGAYFHRLQLAAP